MAALLSFSALPTKIWLSDAMKNEMKRRLIAGSLLLLSVAAFANPKILPMRERAEVIDQWLQTRVQTVLPALMRRSMR